MPKVAILSLGGTIAMGEKSGTSGGVTPSLTAADLVSAVPDLHNAAEIEVHQVCNIPGVALSLTELVMVRDKILELQARGFDGVVITQGTDTIEETSWTLDLICKAQMGIVFTGAMRNPTQPGADGLANLLAAVQAAASEAAREAGVVVAFNDQIHAARFVQKTHTSNVGAFSSPSSGPIGWMAEGVPVVPVRLARIQALDLPENPRMPRVAIIKPGLEDDGALLYTAMSSGIAGLVLEAAGGGHASGTVADAAEHVAKRIPVVFSSRTRAGNVLTATYGFVGSELDLLSRGLIPSGNLDALKARIVVGLSLICGEDSPAIADRLARIATS